MTLLIPDDINSRIEALVASGDHPSAEEVVRSAVSALERERSEIAAMQEGLDDVEAGRVRPLAEVDAEIRAQFGIGQRE